MTKKSDSKWLSLATVPILGQPLGTCMTHFDILLPLLPGEGWGEGI